jgi:hypothetical protein
VPTGEEAGIRAVASPPKEARGIRLATATTIAVDSPISVVPRWVFGRRPAALAEAA